MRHLILLFVLLSFAANLSATPLVPTSYTYTTPPSPSYPDSGGRLTDGFYHVITCCNLGPLGSATVVGFSESSGSLKEVIFHFPISVLVTSVVVDMVNWNDAGVYLPGQIKINSTPFNTSGVFADHTKVAFTLNGSWTGTDLSVALTTGPGYWTFVDEVSFEGTEVPEYGSSLAYLSVALLTLGFSSRRLRSAFSGEIA
jgi:hypothetical protein